MKKTLRILALVFCLMLTASFMVACDKGTGKDDTTTTTTVAVTEAPAEPIDEEAAKEIAFTDAGIPATAAENLTVKFENNTYVVAFDWSGFDYQYTIDASNGEIIEEIFDGSVM